MRSTPRLLLPLCRQLYALHQDDQALGWLPTYSPPDEQHIGFCCQTFVARSTVGDPGDPVFSAGWTVWPRRNYGGISPLDLIPLNKNDDGDIYLF